MSDWLEDAEGKKSRQATSEKIASHVEQRRKLVKANYEAHFMFYDAYVSELAKLVTRVNNLPPAAREPFDKIEGRPKTSKFDNHLFIFSSSYRFKKRKTKGFLSWFGYRRYKHVRVFYLSVSKHNGLADVEIKDYVLEKHRLGKKGEDKSTLHDHHLLQTPIEGLKPDSARRVIDWLAFRSETPTMPFDFASKQL